eukprot:TRINITY_DN61831_c0_g1_i1.p1 TRINITY_DN61831_c0_g1~~TRINITY_DN61831_c0_g1_i1.p1  ORF type:complete len:700 (-),score=92.62 TRINITY_DN61831_c0_g1_i1:36-1880(-)
MLLWVDGLDTAVLTEEQIRRLLHSSGPHTARFGFKAKLVSRADCDAKRSRSPRLMHRDPNLGKVTTASGLQAFNTSWAGVEVTDDEARRRQARAKKFGGAGGAGTTDPSSGAARSTAFVRQKEEEGAAASEELMDECHASTADEEVVLDLGAVASQISQGDGTGVGTMKGTCQKVEKAYLRLTDDPRPEDVRPLPVLRMAVDRLMQLHADEKERSWGYIGDQLRAIRQDLLVQSLQDPAISQEGAVFTEEVYILNARWALQSGDLWQFGQCASQLRALQQQRDGDDRHVGANEGDRGSVFSDRGVAPGEVGLGSSVGSLVPATKHSIAGVRDAVEIEFLACRLLHATLAGLTEDQPQTLTESMACLKGRAVWPPQGFARDGLSDLPARVACEGHTRDDQRQLLQRVCSIASRHRLGNHVRYLSFRFGLRSGSCGSSGGDDASKQGTCSTESLLANFDDRVRLQALRRLCRAFPGGLTISTLARQLRFDDLAACTVWCRQVGGVALDEATTAAPAAQVGSTATSTPLPRLNTKRTAEAIQNHRLLVPPQQAAAAEAAEAAAAKAASAGKSSGPGLATAASVPLSSSALAAQAARARALARKAKRQAAVSPATDEH